MPVAKMVLAWILPSFLFVLAFAPSQGLPQGMSLEELCARCNGTLEIREGDVAHCIVTTDMDMDAAQRASAEAYEQGLTMVPELKIESAELGQEEEGYQDEPVIVVPLNERTFVDGKKLEMDPDENEVDSMDLISAENLENAIFYHRTTLNNEQSEPENAEEPGLTFQPT